MSNPKLDRFDRINVIAGGIVLIAMGIAFYFTLSHGGGLMVIGIGVSLLMKGIYNKRKGKK